MRCDSHVHLVGPIGQYPQLASRTYTADVATLKQLETVAAARAVRRFVIVQPSFYGADDTLLLDGLRLLGARGRGVAVIEPERTPVRTLASYAREGVRGLRLNLYSPIRDKGPLAERFMALAGVAHDLGWHVEIIAPLSHIVAATAVLAQSRVPLVIDHYGLYATARPEDAEGRALLELLAMPHVWMKLSAPYRVSRDHLATRPDPEWLAAMLSAAPDRCVWGSDWPHTPPLDEQKTREKIAPYRPLRYDKLVDDFLEAIGSADLAERILSDNPARLYAFEA